MARGNVTGAMCMKHVKLEFIGFSNTFFFAKNPSAKHTTMVGEGAPVQEISGLFVWFFKAPAM